MLNIDDRKGGCKNMTFLIIGGDNRMVELANIFFRKGYSVCSYGMEKAPGCQAEKVQSLEEAISKCDVIIGPIPFSKGANTVNAPYGAEPVLIDNFFSKIPPEKKLFFGALNKNSRELADKYGIKYFDYNEDESFKILNTIPTVEGAIALMVSETERTVFGSKVLILGYGRIGKLLSEYAKNMGAKVYVEARKQSDLTLIKSRGMNAIHLKDLAEHVGKMDIIINTVPALILDKNMLEKVKDEVLILDLASLPGGVDFEYAKEKGVKTIHALGIPGKIAGKSAAEYIYETIINQLSSN